MTWYTRHLKPCSRVVTYVHDFNSITKTDNNILIVFKLNTEVKCYNNKKYKLCLVTV